MSVTLNELVDLLRRTTDESWLEPLLADPDSRAALNGAMEAFARTSLAAERGCDAGSISLAPGGRPGVATITLDRPAAGAAGTVPKGFRWIDERGAVAVVALDVPVAAGDLTVTLPVETLRHTEVVNTEDDAVWTADLVNNDPGALALVATFPTVTSTPVSGGATDFLSAHGNERGQKRQEAELTEDYRLRVRNIPDAVSPRAISEAVQGVAEQRGLPSFTILEPFEDGSSAALDADLGLSSFDTAFTDEDFLDDPERVIVSRREGCAYLLIRPDAIPRDPDGLRPFYETAFFDDPVFGFLDVSEHPVLVSGLLAVIEEVDRKRAAGVKFDVEVPGVVTKIGQGASAAAVATVVFTIAPPAGKVWHYMDGIFGHTPDPAGASHQVEFRFEDGTIVTSAPYDGPDAQRFTVEDLADLAGVVKRVDRIQGIVTSDGVTSVKEVVAVRVVEATI